MSDYLPPDVWIKILTSLPLKNILQCTIVCKSWYALITSPNFINAHLSLSIAKKETRLLIRESVEKAGINQSGKENYSVHWDNETFDQYAELEFPHSGISGLRIVGSSNGLVLFCDDKILGTYFMFVWNPSIRKFITLPWPIVSYRSHGEFMHTLGFGFHANDYKVVRIVYLETIDGIKIPPEVELYELGTGCWRKICAKDFPYVADQCAPQAFLNGVVHWFGTNRNNGKGKSSQLIVSFDMNNETLGALMVPHCIKHDWDWDMRVAVYKESLSLIHKPRDENYCNIWVMKEYGVSDSWTRQFTVDLNQVNFARR